ELARHLHNALEGTLWNHEFGPHIRARILLTQNRPQEALAALEPAAEFLDRDLDLRFFHALVLHALHRLPETEADLRFVLNHPYMDSVSPSIPAAKFELAA